MGEVYNPVSGGIDSFSPEKVVHATLDLIADCPDCLLWSIPSGLGAASRHDADPLWPCPGKCAVILGAYGDPPAMPLDSNMGPYLAHALAPGSIFGDPPGTRND
jgi:hypothetical protein